MKRIRRLAADYWFFGFLVVSAVSECFAADPRYGWLLIGSLFVGFCMVATIEFNKRGLARREKRVAELEAILAASRRRHYYQTSTRSRTASPISIIAKHAEMTVAQVEANLAKAIKKARANTHPDRTGDRDLFDKVDAAAQLLQ